MNAPDLTELRSLAEACRKADGPDRTIDVLAWAQIGWTAGGDEHSAWRNRLPLGPESIVNATDMAEAVRRYPKDLPGIGRSWNVPMLTSSKDAASSILGEDEEPFVLMSQSDFGGLRRARVFDGDSITTSADAATVPLAILAAALDALVAMIKAGREMPYRA